MAKREDRPVQRPAVPDGAEVFDLNAAVAEAKKGPFYFEWGGDDEVWALSPIGDLDYRDLEQADRGDVESVRFVLRNRMEDHEQGQWKQFDKLDLPVTALDELFKAWLKHNGMKPGELGRSSMNYGATAERSNRASRRRERR